MKKESKSYEKRTGVKGLYECLGIESLPDNMLDFLMHHHSNLQINICNTDVEHGYGIRITKSLRVYLPYEKCNNCQYHSLYFPDDSETGCRAKGGRHTLTKGWDPIFMWDPDTDNDLETKFQDFIDNPDFRHLL